MSRLRRVDQHGLIDLRGLLVIPNYTDLGFLPPFFGDARSMGDQSPYAMTAREFVNRFGTTPERRQLTSGFLNYRQKLRDMGLRDGFQWIDGSFVEDSEANRGRPPADLDVVTFAAILSLRSNHAELVECLRVNAVLFCRDSLRANYGCDAYYVDTTSLSPAGLVASAAYWCNLFGHDRKDALWKGFVRIDLNDDSVVL